jgi:peptidoglycan/xylan/chitin deacetylase (PgdA/CDA1 family)
VADVATRIALTVDVEPSVAGAYADPDRCSPLIDQPVWGDVDGRSEGLGFIMRTLAEHGQRATFFVETANAAYFPEEAMGRYAARLATEGQDVQLHIHPTWLNFADGGDGVPISDHFHELKAERLVALVEDGRARIARWTGRLPEAMRTGNFAISRAVYPHMRQAGIRISSNICAAVFPPADESLMLPGGVCCIDGVMEIPVTCFVDRGLIGRGRLRPLQVTACSFAEQRALLDSLAEQRVGIAVIVTHPFEFLKWKGPQFAKLRPNRMVQDRLMRLCGYLAANPDRFEVVTFSDLDPSGMVEIDPPKLAGHPLRSTVRAAENFLNDHWPS